MKNFTISLYAFYLARVFNDPIERVSKAESESLGQELKDKLSEKLSLKPELTTQILHDTYFADLTFLAPDETIDFLPEDISQCNYLLPDKSEGLLDKKYTAIGQTIIIYGVTSEANQDSANKYVRAFLKDTAYENDNITSSEPKNLLGIPLFEYFCAIAQSTNSQEQYCHILVLLNYQGEKGLKRLSDRYETLINLLCSYHKIKFIYYQEAQLSYRAAVEVAQKIDTEIANFSNYVANKTQNLEPLSNLLDRLPLLALKHSKYCGELAAHLTTIEINQQNYQDSLQELLKASLSLASWQEFSNHTKNIFVKQLQYWLNYMNPSKELSQQLTASIRGIVEIERAKIDRQGQEAEKKHDKQLQNTIQSVGVGVGVGVGIGSIIATSYPLIEKPWHLPSVQNPLLPPHPFVMAIISSFLLGGGLGWLTWRMTRKCLEALSVNRQKLKSAEKNAEKK